MRKLMIALAWRSVVLWLIPVMISFLLFDRTGKLLIDERVFHAIMTVSFSASSVWALRGALLLPPHLRPVYPTASITRYAMLCGVVYFLASCLLDITILVPFINTNENYPPLTPSSWFFQMGLSYITVILQAYLAGAVADKALERNATGMMIDENTNLTTTTTTV